MCQMIKAAACRMYTGAMALLAIFLRTALAVFMLRSFIIMLLTPTQIYNPVLPKASCNLYCNGYAPTFIARAGFIPAKRFANRLPDSLWRFSFLWTTCCKSLHQFIICNY